MKLRGKGGGVGIWRKGVISFEMMIYKLDLHMKAACNVIRYRKQELLNYGMT